MFGYKPKNYSYRITCLNVSIFHKSHAGLLVNLVSSLDSSIEYTYLQERDSELLHINLKLQKGVFGPHSHTEITE